MDNFTYYMLLILLFLAIAIHNMYRLRRERDDFRKRIEYLIEKEKIFSKEMFILLLEKSFYDTNDNFKYIVDKETLVSEKDKKEKDFFNKSVFSDMMRDMQKTIDFLHKENKELALEIIKLRDEKRELENRENLYEKKSPPFFSFEPSFDNVKEESPLVPIYPENNPFSDKIKCLTKHYFTRLPLFNELIWPLMLKKVKDLPIYENGEELQEALEEIKDTFGDDFEIIQNTTLINLMSFFDEMRKFHTLYGLSPENYYQDILKILK